MTCAERCSSFPIIIHIIRIHFQWKQSTKWTERSTQLCHCMAYKWVPAQSDDKLCIHHSFCLLCHFAQCHGSEHFANIVFKWKLNTFLITDKWRYATPKCSNVFIYSCTNSWTNHRNHTKRLASYTRVRDRCIVAYIDLAAARWFACVNTSQHRK